jgi:hypothetical protein
MPKWGTFYWGEQLFGTSTLPIPSRPYNHRRPVIGLTISGTIGKEVTWRWCYGRQMRYSYKTRIDANSPSQQVYRSKFSAAVAASKLLTPAERVTWGSYNKNIGCCPWFLNYVSWYMENF